MENKTILITGASGNIGYEVIRGLFEINTSHRIIAADYKPENAMNVLAEFKSLEFRKLDFSQPDTFNAALKDIDIVFLLRPPNLADVKKYFNPFITAMKENNIQKVVFLSVQGVENQKFIPHYKLEKLIKDEGLEFVFLRPSYFMQNLTTTLLNEIKVQGKIFIPAGKLKFNWVDARDIGLVGAHTLNRFDEFRNQALEITGSDFSDLDEVAKIISQLTQRTITYDSPNLMRFFKTKRKQGISKPMIFVMIMLHYFPRFGKNKARLNDTVDLITGRKPITLKEFIEREKGKFL